MKPSLKATVLNSLNQMKARNINSLAVSDITSITDHIIIASGTSSTHVKSISDNILKDTKKLNYHAIGIEGEREAEWILIDLGDLIVHVMLPGTREYYNLEKLWSHFATDQSLSA